MLGRVSVAAVWPASTFATAVGADAVESAGLLIISVAALAGDVAGVVAESVITTQ